jgi:hypothetical protein
MEVSLMLPWLVFLFAGVLDMGFYLYAAICTENASRVANLQTAAGPASSANSAIACQYALTEMRSVPHGDSLTGCDTPPLVVTAASIIGVDGAAASRVSVTYQTALMIPIPGLRGQYSLTRVSEMRLRSQ